jgi:predicted RNase H-like HicB family nuclease
MNKQALEICVKYRGFVKHSDATGLYISWCPMLDIKSQGTSPEQARASLDDSVRLFVVHCFRRGILEETLRRLGLEEVVDNTIDGAEEEGISVRPLPAASVVLDTWEGTVPLHLGSAPQQLSAQ